MTAMRARMRKEIEMLETDPPHGVSAWPKGDKIDHLEAQILGPDGSPYEKGVFHLDIEIPERYPFEPPKVRFTTPIYHPNIDDAGRICLDTLKMQPKGSWLPSVNISTLLTTIRLLMSEPNADDGLMPEITDMFKHNRELFNRKATEMTAQYARGSEIKQSSGAATPSAAPAAASAKASTIATNSKRPMKSAATAAMGQVASTGKEQQKSRRNSAASEEDSFSDADSEDDDGLSDFSDDEEYATASKRRRTS
ncbi:Ubiquitin-conjugating enzyme e2 t-like [Globisporangium polare]